MAYNRKDPPAASSDSVPTPLLADILQQFEAQSAVFLASVERNQKAAAAEKERQQKTLLICLAGLTLIFFFLMFSPSLFRNH